MMIVKVKENGNTARFCCWQSSYITDLQCIEKLCLAWKLHIIDGGKHIPNANVMLQTL